MTLKPNKETTLAEIVKGLHGAVNPQEMGVKVHYVRETKSGSVQVKFNENSATPAFYNKVKSTMGDRATCALRTGAVILYDIEVGATEEDLKRSLAEELQVEQTEVTCGNITTSARGRSLIVSLETNLVPRALQLRSIGGGWPLAKIREKIDPGYCDNCQLFGHLTRQCTSKVRTERRCLNCAMTDHSRAACTNEPACYVCNGAKHRMNAMACPHFRNCVHQIKKRQQ